MNNPYNPIHSEEWLHNFLNRNFRKKTYTPFHWWRNYKPKRKPLPPRSSTIAKIENGDFDEASYKYEIELIEHKLKRGWDEHYPDIGRVLEEYSIDLARLKRLREDVQKDEDAKLDHLYRSLRNEFGWDRETSMDKLINTNGKSLKQVYKKFKNES